MWKIYKFRRIKISNDRLDYFQHKTKQKVIIHYSYTCKIYDTRINHQISSLINCHFQIVIAIDSVIFLFVFKKFHLLLSFFLFLLFSDENIDQEGLVKSWLQSQPESNQTRLGTWIEDYLYKAVNWVIKQVYIGKKCF